jgi:poly(A) polymerase Pap1
MIWNISTFCFGSHDSVVRTVGVGIPTLEVIPPHKCPNQYYHEVHELFRCTTSS